MVLVLEVIFSWCSVLVLVLDFIFCRCSVLVLVLNFDSRRCSVLVLVLVFQISWCSVLVLGAQFFNRCWLWVVPASECTFCKIEYQITDILPQMSRNEPK